MVFSIQPHQGRWLVFQDGVRVFSAGYRQVEDWLDWAENSGRYSTLPAMPASAMKKGLPQKGDPRFAAKCEEKPNRW